MSYKENLNQIDVQLKKTFKNVSIDTKNPNKININLSSSLVENVNEKLEMSIYINNYNLNHNNPILDWGYYTNTNTKENSIVLESTIKGITSELENILIKNRFNADYLSSLIITEKINEDFKDEIDEEISFEDIYKVKGNDLKINRHNLREHFVQLGFVIEDMVISHFDSESGQPKGKFINDDPRLGDDNELSLSNIISMSHDGEITPKGWLKLEDELKKIPFVEDVYTSTQRNSILVNISNGVFAELY